MMFSPTPRQADVLDALAAYETTKEISAAIGMSELAVKKYLREMRRWTRTSSSDELRLWWRAYETTQATEA